MAKQSAVMILADKIARRIIAEQTFPRLAIGLDAAMIAAHRVFGMGPERLQKFNAAMVELYGEFADIMNADTKDIEYSKATMDAALKQIYGDQFIPWEVRYGK